MSGRPAKHSLTLAGHRTSVSLEESFWHVFRAIARREGVTLNTLAARIDATRGDVGLASAIRVFVLADALVRREDMPHGSGHAKGTDRLPSGTVAKG